MLYAEDSMGHHGGEGVREERDTVESWSRGAEPFLLVDRFPHNYYYISRRFKRRNWSFHRFTEFLLSRLFFFSSDSNLHANERGGMPGGAVHMHDSEKARN